MFVAYSSSNEYCEYTGISIVSLFENCKDMDDLTVFLLNNNISSENINKINMISKNYNRDILLIDPNTCLKEIENEVPLFNGSLSSYCKMLCDKIYPSYVDNLLIIDSDTIINSSLKGIDNIDMSESIIAAVENPDMYISNQNNEEKKIIKKNGFYFNAGILLVNLEMWRKSNFKEQIYQSINELKEFRYADQTILNNAILKSQYKRLEYKYNYWGHLFSDVVRKKRNEVYLNYFTQDDVMNADITPVIIHYKGTHSRPWFIESTSLLKGKYLYYKSISPWKDEPLKSYYCDSTFKNKSFKNRIKNYLLVKYYHSRILNIYWKLKRI